MGAAVAAVHSPAQWAERAMVLADQAHLRYTARRLVERDGVETFAVPSRDRLNTHQVTHDLHTGRVRCDCVAGSYGRACAHSGAVLGYLAQRDQACSQAERESMRRYHAMWG